MSFGSILIALILAGGAAYGGYLLHIPQPLIITTSAGLLILGIRMGLKNPGN
ncbi:MAG TPA: hypothetical protein VF865_03425 [Acidobacteriaceae bacterium]